MLQRYWLRFLAAALLALALLWPAVAGASFEADGPAPPRHPSATPVALGMGSPTGHVARWGARTPRACGQSSSVPSSFEADSPASEGCRPAGPCACVAQAEDRPAVAAAVRRCLEVLPGSAGGAGRPASFEADGVRPPRCPKG